MLLAYCGHGAQMSVKDGDRERQEPFLVPSDGKFVASKDRAELSKTLIPVGELIEQLQQSKAGTRLVLIDAARNEVKMARSAQEVEGLAQIGTARVRMGTSVLFSCSSGQKAFESEKLKHGVFFYYVLEALRGQAANDKGEVTWGRLTEYVAEKTSEQVPELIGGGAKQTPHEIGHLAGRSPLLLRVSR